jgi:hypothetical protein
MSYESPIVIEVGGLNYLIIGFVVGSIFV